MKPDEGMNGTRPKFLKNKSVGKEYYRPPDPYKNAPSCQVDLPELSKYAKKEGKKLVEMTREEIELFKLIR